MFDETKNWVMIGLTFIFVLLYALALLGVIHPLPDDKMVTKLEPIIFSIIGYYFGRVPSQQNENTLKEQIKQHSDAAEAARQGHEAAQQQVAVEQANVKGLEQKLDSAKDALSAVLPNPTSQKLGLMKDSELVSEEVLRTAVAAAFKSLE